MDIFTMTVVIIIMILTTVFVFVRHSSRREMPDRKTRLAPYLMLLSVIVVIADSFAGAGVCMRIPADLIFSISPLLIVASSL